MAHGFTRLMLTFFLATPFVWGTAAIALAPAKGKVILTVSGAIAETNAAETAVFDLAMLEKLPQSNFTTTTPWARQPIKFTGPLLRDVLAAAKIKASGTRIIVRAGNDYQVEIPISDAMQFELLLAHKMDDRPIPERTKGPLFLIYPFDAHPELRGDVYYDRAAWQVKSLRVE
ncbi:MAG: molybdopterin-dependent oxidoreductase [Usitatibacteraceae bacterium]